MPTMIRSIIPVLLLVLAACSAGDAMPSVTTPAQPATGARLQTIVLGMGCFWGAEKRMGALPGVVDVEDGYAGGDRKDARYEDLHEDEGRQRNNAEVVKVTFDPDKTTLERVLVGFWENHDPTQGDRQGNDIGSNYRSAIFTTDDAQRTIALRTRDHYQEALTRAGRGAITTEIAPLRNYTRAEEYHQDYLAKHPDGYCGIGGTGVAYDDGEVDEATAVANATPPLDASKLVRARQLVSYEAVECPYCAKFHAEVMDHWKSPVPIVATMGTQAPTGWTLAKPLFATPTIVLFENGKEVSRYTGYNGDKARFWGWLGQRLLTPEQRRIAFEQGTETAFTGSNLDEHRAGTFVDPVSGAALFRSDAKFDSGTGWPSFFNPVPARSCCAKTAPPAWCAPK